VLNYGGGIIECGERLTDTPQTEYEKLKTQEAFIDDLTSFGYQSEIG